MPIERVGTTATFTVTQPAKSLRLSTPEIDLPRTTHWLLVEFADRHGAHEAHWIDEDVLLGLPAAAEGDIASSANSIILPDTGATGVIDLWIGRTAQDKLLFASAAGSGSYTAQVYQYIDGVTLDQIPQIDAARRGAPDIDVRGITEQQRTIDLNDLTFGIAPVGAARQSVSTDTWGQISLLLGRVTDALYTPATRTLTLRLAGSPFPNLTVTLPTGTDAIAGLVRFARNDELSGSQTADNLVLDVGGLEHLIGDNDLIQAALIDVIESATGDKLEQVESDDTLSGVGTVDSPLEVTTPFTQGEKTKLAGIEEGATAGGGGGPTSGLNQAQVDGRISTRVEAAAQVAHPTTRWGKGKLPTDTIFTNTQRFNTQDRAKLDGIERGATADQTGAEVTLNTSNFGGNLPRDADTTQKAAQAFNDYTPPIPTGVLTSVDTDATLTGDGTSTSALSVANPFTDADETKLDGIEDNATRDQTPAEIRDALQSLDAGARLDASAIRNLPTGGGSTTTGAASELAVASPVPAASTKDEGVIVNAGGGKLVINEESGQTNVQTIDVGADPTDGRFRGLWDFAAGNANDYGSVLGGPTAYSRIRFSPAREVPLPGGRANDSAQLRIPKSVMPTKETRAFRTEVFNTRNGFTEYLDWEPTALLDTSLFWGWDITTGTGFPIEQVGATDRLVLTTTTIDGGHPVPMRDATDVYDHYTTGVIASGDFTGTGQSGKTLALAHPPAAAFQQGNTDVIAVDKIPDLPVDKISGILDHYVNSLNLALNGQVLTLTLGRLGTLEALTANVTLPTTSASGGDGAFLHLPRTPSVGDYGYLSAAITVRPHITLTAAAQRINEGASYEPPGQRSWSISMNGFGWVGAWTPPPGRSGNGTTAQGTINPVPNPNPLLSIFYDPSGWWYVYQRPSADGRTPNPSPRPASLTVNGTTATLEGRDLSNARFFWTRSQNGNAALGRLAAGETATVNVTFSDGTLWDNTATNYAAGIYVWDGTTWQPYLSSTRLITMLRADSMANATANLAGILSLTDVRNQVLPAVLANSTTRLPYANSRLWFGTQAQFDALVAASSLEENVLYGVAG